MTNKLYHKRRRLTALEAAAARAVTPWERAIAARAAEPLRKELASSPPPLLPDHLKRFHGLLRTVRNAKSAALLHWAGVRVREARAAGAIEWEDLALLLEALKRTAAEAGLGGWETQMALDRAMKCQPWPRERRR